MALIFVFSFGIIIFWIEPQTFPTVFEGVWWAIITTSTVGYGDYAPVTILGRIVGITLILLGAGFVSTYFITLATATVTKQNNFIEGKVMYKGKNHFIIIGWNERSREIINRVQNEDKYRSIILIDETLEKNPLLNHSVHFIRGRSNRDDVLIKANILSADKVLITADQNKDELQADMFTILTLLAIKGLNSKVHCIAEILTTEQISNAKRAGADEVIQSNILTSFVMVNSLTDEGIAESIFPLLDHLNGNKLSFSEADPFVGKSFLDANSVLLHQGTLLLGIKRGENTIVNPPNDYTIETNDQLLLIEKYLIE
ncbi:potassium channel family protein [Bacillus sp. 31A1R]|uniref:Potassium channel family protein n=1 Tax=Robertmurraya mangrovi TaxID=3098077 RepID=A0ABU5IXZ7_9BACI|nr:potassium channel family protein [Bacillus sp. 31A1R]MDZ5472049.1 potassium channel family protein [Bacillus sp. 31A1R]